ncbi:MAG: DUF1211 domain-containing protein [Methanosphaera stadtmanae]|nr:DUF1211 domain-containing protein [Methanosphaera stadtmanae]
MVKNRFFNNNILDRHLAITDGIFAIAMTILVLEIAVPTISDITSGMALGNYFTSYLIPAIIIYFISFFLVYNFWETTTILFSFKKISNNILFLNMFALATVCLIPFATGFLFSFYKYFEVNLFFSCLILIISIIYLIILLVLIKDNFSEIFENKDKLKDKYNNKIEEGIVFPNFKIYMRGAVLTIFYLVLSPIIISIISILLALISPVLSILSFILILLSRLIIRMRRMKKDLNTDNNLTDAEKEFLKEIENTLYD